MAQKSDRIALFISVLLHSLLVFLPRQEEPLPLAESSTPTRSISVVELPPLPKSESQPPLPAVPSRPSSPPAPVSPSRPSPPPAPVIPPSPPTPVVPPSPPVTTPAAPPADLPPEAPKTETSDGPTDQPMPDADSETDSTPEPPIPETNDNSTNEPANEPADEPADEPEAGTSPDSDAVPAPTPADEAQIAAEWEHLVGYFENQDDGFAFYDLQGIFNTFGEPGQVNQFFHENNQPKLDVFSFYHFTKQTPDQVFEAVVRPELTSNTGFDSQLQENFSAGRAYQLLQGEMLRYLIIVPLDEGSGSVLMLSDSLPEMESEKL